MEMHQLEYVLAVAKYNNFTRAAEEIKISQSSLSQQINKLENELGTNLFVRTTRSVQLTPAGREFLTHAQRIMSGVIEAKRCIQEYVSIVKGEIRLGTLAVVGSYNLPNLVASFLDDFPGIKPIIIEAQCEELLYMVHCQKLDAAFVQIKSPNPDFQYYPLVSDKMVVVTSHRHPFANRLSIDIKELKNEKFILTHTTSGNYHDFYAACQAAGFVPNVVLNCSIAKTMLAFVREELGITAFSSKVALEELDPSLRIIALTPTIQRRIYLVTRSETVPTPTLKLFIKHTNQWLKTQTCLDQAKESVINSNLARNNLSLVR